MCFDIDRSCSLKLLQWFNGGELTTVNGNSAGIRNLGNDFFQIFITDLIETEVGALGIYLGYFSIKFLSNGIIECNINGNIVFLKSDVWRGRGGQTCDRESHNT